MPDIITLIHINQYNSVKYTLEKEIGDADKNTRYKWFSHYTCFELKN